MVRRADHRRLRRQPFGLQRDSGDIYLETTADVTVGVAGFGITQNGSGNVQVDAGGDLIFGGDIDVGTRTLTLNAAGTITSRAPEPVP
jgi:hypothetical protein